jgi:hypothetical protein
MTTTTASIRAARSAASTPIAQLVTLVRVPTGSEDWQRDHQIALMLTPGNMLLHRTGNTSNRVLSSTSTNTKFDTFTWNTKPPHPTHGTLLVVCRPPPNRWALLTKSENALVAPNAISGTLMTFEGVLRPGIANAHCRHVRVSSTVKLNVRSRDAFPLCRNRPIKSSNTILN